MQCQKDKFDLEPHIHYLNGAYMSPTSHRVAAAGIEGVKRKMRPYTVSPQDFFMDVDRLKSLFARMVNAPSGASVALIPAASYGLETVAQNIPYHKGQNIVVLEAQFPSNVYTWREMAKTHDLSIRTVPLMRAGEQWNAQVLESIDRETVVVAMEHVHWMTGTKFDLAAIGRRCREVGAKLIIDGTQSVGALPMDVQAFGVDALVCGGYKWLSGSYSLGYAYFSDDFLAGKPLENNWIARKNSEDFRGLIDYQDAYQPGAARFDMGEKSNFISVPMGIEALSQLMEWGIDNIQNYCRDLTKNHVEIWKNHGFAVDDPQWRGHHLFGIQTPAHIEAGMLADALRAKNVMVSVRGDFIRISPNVYNDEADMAALSAVLVG